MTDKDQRAEKAAEHWALQEYGHPRYELRGTSGYRAFLAGYTEGAKRKEEEMGGWEEIAMDTAKELAAALEENAILQTVITKAIRHCDGRDVCPICKMLGEAIAATGGEK